MPDATLSREVLENILSLITKNGGGALGSAASSLLSAVKPAGGLGALAGMAGGLLGGAKSGADGVLDKLAAAVKAVLAPGALPSGVADLFKGHVIEGATAAAVASKFGVTESAVADATSKAVAAIRDRFLA
ncbi:MAG: hypothetical protein IJ678_01430 [Kiritimatiellae bacterium]|nr:hypothetical protein [Kiritimatiellia bacterium]